MFRRSASDHDSYGSRSRSRSLLAGGSLFVLALLSDWTDARSVMGDRLYPNLEDHIRVGGSLLLPPVGHDPKSLLSSLLSFIEMKYSALAALAVFLVQQAEAQVAEYGQCGGLSYTGSTTCVSVSVRLSLRHHLPLLTKCLFSFLALRRRSISRNSQRSSRE